MILHLGTRVSALLDGQLSPDDEERAWDHVHSCHQCRDAVEREGWVKTRLSTMQYAGATAPSSLKGSLMVSGLMAGWGLPEHSALTGARETSVRRRHLGLTGISGGAVGAAVMGVLALGASPANAPGAVVRPVDNPLGGSLGGAITSLIEGGRLADHDRKAPATPRSAHDAPRTLAP